MERWGLGIGRFCVIGLLLLKVPMDGGIVCQSKEFHGDGECSMEGMASTRVGGLSRLAWLWLIHLLPISPPFLLFC